jgi:hypothetical protein
MGALPAPMPPIVYTGLRYEKLNIMSDAIWWSVSQCKVYALAGLLILNVYVASCNMPRIAHLKR